MPARLALFPRHDEDTRCGLDEASDFTRRKLHVIRNANRGSGIEIYISVHQLIIARSRRRKFDVERRICRERNKAKVPIDTRFADTHIP